MSVIISNNIDIVIIVLILVIIAIIAIFAIYKRIARINREKITQAFGKIPPTLKDYELESIKQYSEYYTKNIKSNNRIDNTTWNDLNMDEIFERINACNSSIGEEYLYNLLHELNASDNESREKFILWCEQNPQRRIDIQTILKSMGKKDNNGLSHYLFNASANRIANSWIFILLAVLPIFCIILSAFISSAGIFIAIIAFIVNIFIYSYYKVCLDMKLESLQYFLALLYGAKKISKFGYNFKLYEPLKPFARLGGFVSGQTNKRFTDLESLTMLIKMLFLIDLIRYNHVVSVMMKNMDDLNELYKIIGEIDSAISILSFRHSLSQYCLPQFTEQKKIEFNETYHPLIENPVTNRGIIANGSIITGSNASGKSTFIKALAVNNILAQTINTCCAKSYTLKTCYVATSMALKDNILSGESYFITEIKSLKRIMDYCSQKYCTCFVDEILRGTNTPERIAASTAVLKQLKASGSLCVVASHDIELTKLLKEIYDNYHFCETVADNEITFDYHLKDGPSTTTNAILLLSHMGFDENVINDASKLISFTNIKE